MRRARRLLAAHRARDTSVTRTAHVFFRLVTGRHEKASPLNTANQTVGPWGQVFGDEVPAAAILNRLLHHNHTITVTGGSCRLKQKKRAGLFGATAATKDWETPIGGSVLVSQGGQLCLLLGPPASGVRPTAGQAAFPPRRAPPPARTRHVPPRPTDASAGTFGVGLAASTHEKSTTSCQKPTVWSPIGS